MENYSVYQDMASRTGGDIYIGVVGPVRTGKSTFIRRFMETLVLPYAVEGKSEMIDELPQAAAGKTIMTTEPKFVPAKAVKVMITRGAEASVRLVDCVGFAVEGANGFEEDGAPRLVKTPWQEEAMPFEKAAALGTEKVIKEHSTIGVLVTTDGSVTGIERRAYVAAEERAVGELKGLGKPFVILLNVKEPMGQISLVESLEKKYGVPVVALNVETMEEKEILEVLKKALFEFPVTRIDVKIPQWLQSLPEESQAVDVLLTAVKKASGEIVKMRDCVKLENLFDDSCDFINPDGVQMDLGRGRVEFTVEAKEKLFYQILSEICGETLENDLTLLQYVKQISAVKETYNKVKDAFLEAEEKGYGVVSPMESEYALEKPALVKKSAGHSVQFKANAPSYHIIRVNVTGSVNPIIGTQQQGEEFIKESLQRYEEGAGIWETNIFGKSLRDLMSEELSGKGGAMPTELRKKIGRTISRIVNDGKGNLICILF